MHALHWQPLPLTEWLNDLKPICFICISMPSVLSIIIAILINYTKTTMRVAWLKECMTNMMQGLLCNKEKSYNLFAIAPECMSEFKYTWQNDMYNNMKLWTISRKNSVASLFAMFFDPITSFASALSPIQSQCSSSSFVTTYIVISEPVCLQNLMT